MSTTRINTGIGVGQGTAIYVAAILGAGILALPSLAAKVAGPASLGRAGAAEHPHRRNLRRAGRALPRRRRGSHVRDQGVQTACVAVWVDLGRPLAYLQFDDGAAGATM